MYSISINERVTNIKGNQQEIDLFVDEYLHFVISCARKSSGKHWIGKEDDEFSIALYAFVCAIDAYDENRGNFLMFAKGIIRNHLIDYYRKEKKHIYNNVAFDDDENDENPMFEKASIDNFQEYTESEYRKWELEQFKKELTQWDISLLDLVKISPKHDSTRILCASVVEYLSLNNALLEKTFKKRAIPLNEIEKNIGITAKSIERYRKYIIALLIIETGDYEHTRGYICDWKNPSPTNKKGSYAKLLLFCLRVFSLFLYILVR